MLSPRCWENVKIQKNLLDTLWGYKLQQLFLRFLALVSCRWSTPGPLPLKEDVVRVKESEWFFKSSWICFQKPNVHPGEWIRKGEVCNFHKKFLSEAGGEGALLTITDFSRLGGREKRKRNVCITGEHRDMHPGKTMDCQHIQRGVGKLRDQEQVI